MTTLLVLMCAVNKVLVITTRLFYMSLINHHEQKDKTSCNDYKDCNILTRCPWSSILSLFRDQRQAFSLFEILTFFFFSDSKSISPAEIASLSSGMMSQHAQC